MFLSKWLICRFHVNLPGCIPKMHVDHKDPLPSPPVSAKVAVMLQQKADPNLMDLAGHYPLLCAVESGSVELIEDWWLLDNVAWVNRWSI